MRGHRSTVSLQVLLLGLSAAATVAAYGTEISPTVSIFRLQELNLPFNRNGKSATSCEHQVYAAAAYGGTRINFMLTLFYAERDGDNVPDSYCWKLDETQECIPFTQQAIAMWTANMTSCLQYAVRSGFTGFAFTPHMDGGVGIGQWRNAMIIDPLAKYGGFSYTDVMLLPLAQAMNAVMADNMTVWFALQGEMSAMVFRYPQQHQRLLPYLKSVVIGNNAAWAPKVRMGVSTNYNKLCGLNECTPSLVNTPVYNLPAVQSLYKAVDFVGISCYPKYTPENLTSLEYAAKIFDGELKLFGVDLEQLVNVQGKEFILNEFGMGGGLVTSGDQVAKSAVEVWEHPFHGIFGSYMRKLDPWKTYLPDTVVVAARQAVEEWYKAASLWLLRKGGPTWRVDGAYLWNLNSWDVLGVHTETPNKEGTYWIEAIADTVRAHNLRVNGKSDSQSSS